MVLSIRFHLFNALLPNCFTEAFYGNFVLVRIHILYVCLHLPVFSIGWTRGLNGSGVAKFGACNVHCVTPLSYFR